MELKNGTLLKNGTYRIERFISSGGFGCTYEARHLYSNRKVAIKEFFIRDFCNRDEKSSYVTVGTQSKKALVERLKEKFVDEANSIWNLNHKGIVRVSDVFEENGTAYYVMDYIEGKSLEEKIKDKVNLSEEETLVYVRQVADTLRYIHSKNILHLDIKPGNIMIDEEDNAILIDFGASKQYDEVDGENTSTLLLKTPGYAPLEQMDNEVGVFFPSTDIYALGATMYKMLTGITPPNAIKLAGKFKMQPLPDNISYNTRNAVEKAMQKDKEDRPQSIDEFLKLLDGDAKKEKKESLWKKWMRRKKDIVEEQSDIIVTVDEDAPKPRKNLIPILLAVILCIVGIEFVINITDNNDKYNDLYNKGIRYIEAKSYDSAMNEFDKAMIYKDNHVCLFVEDAAEMYDSLGDMTRAKKSYLTMIEEGDSLAKAMKYDAAISKYDEAKKLEEEYAGTEFSQEFNEDAGNKIVIVNDKRSLHTTMLRNKNSYLALINEGDKLLSEKKYDAAISKYEEAKKYEEEYAGTEFSQEFNEDAAGKKSSALLEKERQEQYNRTHGSKNGHDWVDLGLPSGLKWATCNVGASSPEEYGNYYAWGETEPAPGNNYSEANCEAHGLTISELQSQGIIDGDHNLTPSHDAARANWGGTWRLPTKAELEELKNKCTWKWTTQNGVKGYKVTGPNGNSIFLPAAGNRNGSSLRSAGVHGSYWSSTPDEGDSRSLHFDGSNQSVVWSLRNFGRSVRPVTEFSQEFNEDAAGKKSSALLEKERQEQYNRTHGSKNGHDWVDLGLSVKWATCNVGANKPEDYGNYYAWGETKTKSTYYDDNSVTWDKSISDIGGKSQYDAARANWGGTWRLPTKAEMVELIDKCTWKWTTQNGVKGYKVTGPNGNSIFLPAAGNRDGSSLGSAGVHGSYWSSSPYESYSNYAYYLRFYSSSQNVGWYGRYYGFSVRPVAE